MALLNRLKWLFILILALAILTTYGSISFQLIPLSTIFTTLAPRLAFSLLLLIAGKLFLEIASPFITSIVQPPERGKTARRILRYFLWFFVAFAILSIFVGDFTAFLMVLTILLLAAGYSFHQLLLDFAGWLLIKAKNPYSIGDDVRIGQISGRVVKISALDTLILQKSEREGGATPYSGRLIHIPNSTLLTSPITVPIPSFPYIWDTISINVAYDSDYDVIVQLLLKTSDDVIGNKKMAENVKEYKRVMQSMGIEPESITAPSVFLAFKEGGATVTLSYFIRERTRQQIRTALLSAIWAGAKKNKQKITLI